MTTNLKDGETAEIKGSALLPYIIKNVGGVYSCSCPAWRNQSQPIERRTCKHIRKLRGDEAEMARIGGSLVMRAGKTKAKVTKVAPALLLAHKWEPDIDPKGWWMSEKLDGVRAYWNGKELISRLGNKFYAPKWLTDDLPKKVHLDGELFLGRGQFQKAVSIVRRQDEPANWAKISYIVFDAVPHGEVKETDTFESRWLVAEAVVTEAENENIKIHPHRECTGVAHLKRYLKEVENQGGEGVMLRQARSKYERARSHTLLKVKTFLDVEATVIGHEPGKGRHKGRLGAVLAELDNGKKFKAGTGFSDVERENPPAVGSRITVRFVEYTNDGIPRFPVYAGPAIDK